MAETTNTNGLTIQPIVNENLTPQKDTSSATTVNGPAFGVEESVSSFGIPTQQLQEPIIDYSLSKGNNVDNSLSITETNSLAVTRPAAASDSGLGFNLDSFADISGIAGLFNLTPKIINTNVQPPLDPLKNVLHEYATYTYRITLGAQNLKDHQQITADGYTRGAPKLSAILMSSGGARKVDNLDRNPIFNEDFYIEDLKMHTIIGSHAQGNGSNTVNIEFNIIEPYAVSLIERLLALGEELGYRNYIEIPFVFKIEFIGYDDAGQQQNVIPNTTKYIPFRLTYMKFEVKGQGSMYQCTAIPVNHFALNQTVASIPEPIEVAASTVGEFFNGKAVGDSGSNSTGGFVDRINAYHNRLVAKTGVNSGKTISARDFPDKIKIMLHKDIADATISVGNLSKVAMIKEEFRFRSPHIDSSKPTTGFNPGTSVSAIIEQLIKNSSFYLDQIEESERIDKLNAQNKFIAKGGAYKPVKKKPIIDFKITSSYQMTEYDAKVNRHAYEAVYYVEPREVVAIQSTLMGRQEVENVAKDYQYLFTGQNQDIKDIDIKFDLAFYNAIPSNTESAADGTPVGSNKVLFGDDKGNNAPNNTDPITTTPIHNQNASAVDNTGTAAKEDRKKLKASALRRSIMQDSTGDMVTFDLTIYGDPAFIKQDDILYRSTDPDFENPFTDTGSIKQDNGDMYIRLRFNVYDDIDHENGLRVKTRQIPGGTFNRSSVFDGFYRILQIENTFIEGKFEQQLVVIRTYVQGDEEVREEDSSLISADLDILNVDIFGSPDNNDLTIAQEVTEQRTAGDSNRPAVNEATLATDSPTTTVNAETIIETSTAQPINADRQ